MKRAVTSARRIACLVVLTAACGEKPSQSARSTDAPRPSKDMCALLTAEDIKEVIGVAPGPVRFENNQCIWPSVDKSDDFVAQLLVAPTLVRSYEDLRKQYREQLDTDPDKAIHPIDGVGTFAVGFNEMPMVQVFSNSTMVQVSTFGHQEKHALELAKRAVSRLK